MKTLGTLFFIAFGGFMLLTVPETFAAPVDATANRVLSASVKQGLMAAKPVRGAGVGRETFDGKPVLVVFFASW